jgi:hypothetical protein
MSFEQPATSPKVSTVMITRPPTYSTSISCSPLVAMDAERYADPDKGPIKDLSNGVKNV